MEKMRVLFKKEDFSLCDVPVPKGYPQSQTHCGVSLYKGVYFLTSSPYPNKRLPRWKAYLQAALRKLSGGLLCKVKDGEVYENPCIYRGVQERNNAAPTRFEPITDNPLMDTPEYENGLPAYNSDPDLFIDDGKFYILNRSVYRTNVAGKGYESWTRISLIEGGMHNGQFVKGKISTLKEGSHPYISPCLIKKDGKYFLFYLDSKSAVDSSTFTGLYCQTAQSIEELSEKDNAFQIKVSAGKMLPWHMSCFLYKNNVYAVIACVRKGDVTKKVWQMLGSFNQDLTELVVYQAFLSDYNSYRGAAIVRDDGVFVLYSTTVAEMINGSRSVDGRDIIVATMPFDDVLNIMESR